jgi:class 3 adenylate cyclase
MVASQAAYDQTTDVRFPTPRVSDDVVALALDRALLDWEMTACRTLTVLGIACFVLALLVSPWIGATLATTQAVASVITTVYFLVVRQTLQLLGGAQRHATLDGLRWCAVTLEVSFASVSTLITLRIQGAEWAATSPITMVYPLVLVAASFRLRPALSVYAAVLATVQWLLVYYVGIAPRLPTDPELPTLEAWAAWERAFWILGAGGLLAIAAHRLRALVSTNLRQSHLRWTAVHELERLVSPDVASRALAGALVPGAAERRHVTVLFCDLRDFTALCEHRRAEEAMQILNAFYERACAVIADHDGHVNKFLGDGVLVLFSDEDHAAAAVRCARGLLKAADELRAQGGVWEELEIGIGVDTGDVLLGAVGARDRVEYTAIGSTVNRAARLQAHSAATGRRIVLSARTATELGERIELLPLGEAKIKGVDRPIRIYTPR